MNLLADHLVGFWGEMNPFNALHHAGSSREINPISAHHLAESSV
jgi:hypothetical protein